MYFTTHTRPGGKYVWQRFNSLGDSEGDWPDLEELTIDAFSTLLLSDEDRKIGRDLHPPTDGKNWPKKHMASGTTKGGVGVANSLDKIGCAHLQGQLAIAESIKTFSRGGAVGSSEKLDLFSFEFFRFDIQEECTIRCESMSPLHDNGDTKMEEVVDYM